MVGIGWVVDCVEQRARVDETKYLIDIEGASIAGSNKRRRSMLPKHLLDLCEALCGDRADKAGGTKTSQALAGIAGRCQNIADEMIKLLGKFKVSGDSSKRSLLKIWHGIMAQVAG